MKILRRIGLLFAWCVASVGRATFAALILVSMALWALGTRGVPLVADVAQKFMGGQLTVARAEGGLFGPIVLEGIVLDSPGERTEIDRLRLDWSPRALWRRQVQVDSLAVGRIIVQQKTHAPKPPQPLQARLPRDLVVHSARVEHFELRPVDGTPLVLESLVAKASWIQEKLSIDSLQLQHAQAGLVRASARATLAPKTITIESLQVDGPASLSAQGVFGLMGEASDLTATLKDGRWPLQGEPQVRLPQLDASARGVISGEALDVAITLKGALRTAIEQKALGFDVDGAMQLSTKGARIERLLVKNSNGAGSLSAQGDAEWLPALKVNAKAEIQKLDPGILLPEWKGQLNGQLEARTEMVGAVPEVRFKARLDNSTLRGYPLQLDARGMAALQGDTQRLQLDALTLSSGSTTLKAEGAVLPRLDAKLSIDASDLKTLLPSLAGALQLDASAQGEPAHPSVQAKGNARGLRLAENRIDSALIELDYAPSADSRARLNATGVQIGETLLATASLLVEGRIERHTVKLQASLASPRSAAALTLVGAADLEAQSWKGELQQSTFTPPYGPVWQQEAAGALSLAAAQQRLEPTCWRAGSAKLCLDATLAAPLTRVAYRIEQLDTADFAALLPKDWVIATTLNGRGEVALDGAAPTTLDLDLKLGEGRIVMPGAPALKLLPSTVLVQQAGGVWQGRAALAVDRGTLDVEASLPVEGGTLLERPITGRVRLKVPDLAWATPLLPPQSVQDLKGALDGDFNIAGTAAAPQLLGALKLVGGSLRVPAAGIVVKDIEAEVRGGNTGVLNISASASSGGTLKLSGTADFADGKPVVQLRITGQDVQVADIADARAWVSPDLVYAQDAEGMKLTGTVTVPKADITPRKLAANAIGASGDQVLVGADAPAIKSLPLTAEVTIVLGDKVTFEGFGLKSRITGRVTAIDRPGGGGTRGRGELELVDAAYKAYGQEIQVATGRILFNGGPIGEPTVDIVARRSPREDVTVSLRVRGTLDQPTFDLSSSPAMPREQQLGWLIFGRPIDSGTGGEFSGAAAALSLGIAGGDALASRIGKVIGLDQVSLGADSTSSAWQSSNSNLPTAGTTDQTRFTVGKYLSPKLFVSYGLGLFDNGNVLRLLYDLGRGFKLRTEAGLETGGDVLYSVER
ncbi:MAG: translocation/assembly module TamB domain-containing protein [Pseudomonadota bacterium]